MKIVQIYFTKFNKITIITVVGTNYQYPSIFSVFLVFFWIRLQEGNWMQIHVDPYPQPCCYTYKLQRLLLPAASPLRRWWLLELAWPLLLRHRCEDLPPDPLVVAEDPEALDEAVLAASVARREDSWVDPAIKSTPGLLCISLCSWKFAFFKSRCVSVDFAPFSCWKINQLCSVLMFCLKVGSCSSGHFSFGSKKGPLQHLANCVSYDK